MMNHYEYDTFLSLEHYAESVQMYYSLVLAAFFWSTTY
jgi:hypothetical protein